MPASNWFWIIYVISVLFCGGWYYPEPRRVYGVGFIVVMVLIGILGYAIFHSPIRN